MNNRGRARLWPPLAVAVLLAAAALAAALSSPGIGRVPLPSERESPGAASGSAPEPSASAGTAQHVRPPYDLDIPGWFSTALAVLCGAAVVAVVALLLWYVVRDTIQVRGRRIAVEPGTPPAPC